MDKHSRQKATTGSRVSGSLEYSRVSGSTVSKRQHHHRNSIPEFSVRQENLRRPGPGGKVRHQYYLYSSKSLETPRHQIRNPSGTFHPFSSHGLSKGKQIFTYQKRPSTVHEVARRSEKSWSSSATCSSGNERRWSSHPEIARKYEQQSSTKLPARSHEQRQRSNHDVIPNRSQENLHISYRKRWLSCEESSTTQMQISRGGATQPGGYPGVLTVHVMHHASPRLEQILIGQHEEIGLFGQIGQIIDVIFPFRGK